MERDIRLVCSMEPATKGERESTGRGKTLEVDYEGRIAIMSALMERA